MKKYLLLSLCLLLTLGASAQRSSDRVSLIELKTENKSYYERSDGKVVKVDGNKCAYPKYDNDQVLKLGATQSEEVMYTTYDFQSNGQVSNRMYHREDGSVAVVATMSHDYDQSASDRGTAYNFFDGSSWGDYPYERAEANATGNDMRTGWPSIAPYGENGEILVNHSNGLNYYIRETAGEGLWDGPYSIPAFDYSYSLSWPRVVTSGENNEIIHVVAAAQNTDNNGNTVTTQFYCRSTDGENWEVNYSPLVETNEHIGIYSADDYCVSANGDVVAVVYATPFHGDVLMFKSTDNGLSWTKYVVWENPYKGNWETDDETITEDVAQTPTMSTVAVGPDGVVHVAFSVANYVHSELGTTFSYYHGRTVDGIAYWNDRREPISNIKLWNEGEDGYMHHSYDSINFCGWMPFYDNIAEFDNNMIYRENDYIYTFYGACSGYPALSVDTEGNLALAYSTIDSRRNNGSHYYRSVFVSYKAAGDESWNVAVEDLTEDFMFTLTEAISVSAASVSAKENEFWFSFLGDDTPGFYWGNGASQSHATDNYVYVSKFVPGEYGDDDNNDEITQAYRKVLIETFTGRNSGYEPDAHKIANELAAANPGRVFPINIHCGGFSPTSYPNMNTTDGTEMMNAFNVSGFPSGNINRNSASAIGRNQWNSETYNQLSQIAEVNVSGGVVINPLNRVAEITVDLDYISNSNYNTNYLTVMMLQDSIWGSQSGGSSNPEQYVNGQYCHMHVLRDIITPTWGDAVSPTTAGTHITKTYIYEIPEIIGAPNGVDVDLNNIYFLAFVTEAYQGTPTRPVLNIDKLDKVYGTDEAIYPYISTITDISEIPCSSMKTLNVNLVNGGLNNITSLGFEIYIDGYFVMEQVWHGNIPSYQSSNIQMDVEIPVGTHDVEIKIVEANGIAYENEKTVSITSMEWTTVLIDGEKEEFTIDIMQDKYGNQITWELVASDGTTLASGGPYNMLLGGSAATQLHRETVTINNGECVQFAIRDNVGNGICCEYGEGYYQIKDSKGKIIVNGDGDFGSEDSVLISVVQSDQSDIECEAPTDLTYYIDEYDYNNVILSWSAPAGADSANVTYEIYSSSTSMTPLYYGITETSFTIEDLSAGNYRYVVRANWNDECLSDPSNVVYVSIICSSPQDLTYYIDEFDYNNVTLSWTAPAGADSANVTYEIYSTSTSMTPLYHGISETSYTIEDLTAGNYRYVVRANWNDECLSAPSNMVEFTIADCAPDDMIELTIMMSDSYGDGWNGGNIEIVGETNGSTYTVTLNDGSNDTITLSLCPDVYYFNWNNGVYDGEVGFEIFVEENEVYSVAEGTIDDSFSNPFFVLRFEDIFASISDVTYTSAFCSTETNFNINVVNEGLQEITSLKMEVIVDGTNNGDANWLYYDDGVLNNGIGGPEAFYWGIMFPASTLESYAGSFMTKVSIFDYATSSGDIMIYYGGSSSPQYLIHTQPYSLSGTNEFVEFDLTSALPINPETNVWVIFSTSQGANHPASCCANTGDSNGRWISLDGSTWEDLMDYSLDNTWMIRAFVTDETRTSVSELMPITDYNYNVSDGILKAQGCTAINTNSTEKSGETIEFTWQGSIPSYQSANIETTLDLPVGHHKVDFRIVEINGVPFQTSKSIDVNVEEGIDTYVNGNSGEYTIDVMTNGYGGTISWEIITSDNSVLSSDEFSNNGTYLNTETVTIPAGECVRFIIRNSNNNFNNGYYRIFDGKGNVVVYNEGNFGYEQSYLLSVISDDDMDDSYAENTFNVNVDVPGTLSYKLAAMIEHWSDVYVLKVNGELNTSDFDVFSKCTHLMTLDLTQTNITSIGGCKELSRLRNVYLPTTVTSVNNQAFYNCKSLYSMDLPNATTIGYRAFYNCYSLTSINIPNVTSIDYDAFAYCQSLTSIDISNATNLSNNNNYGIFYYCTNLTEVILSDELTYIPYECFYYCTSLQEINFPASLKTIDGYAFYGCALTDINIPEGVTSIANYAFNGCPATTISIPSSITSIGSNVFSNGNITDVYCYAATPVTTSTFNGGLSYATLHVPEFSVVAYKVHDSWYKFNIVALDELLSDVYINSDYTIVDYNGLADEVNLTLDRNAHLTVTAGSEFNLNNYKQITSNTEYYEYDNNWNYTYYYPSTLITYNEMNADNVEVSLVLRTDRWNFISLPFDVNVSDITYPEGTLWVVRKYSGEDRANMTGNTWHNMTDGMTLNAGEGYILHCDHGNTSYVTFTFPAVNNESMNNMFTYQDFEQHLEIYPSEFAHNRSWNLVGNPYPSYFNTNGNIEHNGIITVWDNAYVAYSLLDDYFTLKPYESFFVQCPDDATSMLFKTEGRSHTNDYDDYSKRDEAFRQRNSGDRKIYNFTLNNEEYSDRTRLVLNEAASVDYELSCDASKFMNEDENVPQIYVYDNEVIYAINERPLGLGVMSLGIRIGQAGEYTLTLDPKEEYGLKVVLYDNETREEIDILNGSYTFFAEEGYDNNRFVLTITENTIGVDENYVLDINDPDVEVYDIYGRRVRVSDVKNGLYILRKGDKVQRYFISE